MLLQTNSYIVPKDKRAEHARLMRRFRQILNRLGCDDFEIYEQVGANWGTGQTSGRFVQLMRFRDRRHQLSVQAAERDDQAAQELIAEFCGLINYPVQQQQQQFAVGFYSSVLPIGPSRSRAAGEEPPAMAESAPVAEAGGFGGAVAGDDEAAGPAEGIAEAEGEADSPGAAAEEPAAGEGEAEVEHSTYAEVLGGEEEHEVVEASIEESAEEAEAEGVEAGEAEEHSEGAAAPDEAAEHEQPVEGHEQPVEGHEQADEGHEQTDEELAAFQAYLAEQRGHQGLEGEPPPEVGESVAGDGGGHPLDAELSLDDHDALAISPEGAEEMDDISRLAEELSGGEPESDNHAVDDPHRPRDRATGAH